MASTSASSSVVTLNVGGELFQTTAATLSRAGASSLLTSLSPSPSSAPHFLDRDPRLFTPILSFLHCGRLVSSPPSSALLAEARHFAIDGALLTSLSPASAFSPLSLRPSALLPLTGRVALAASQSVRKVTQSRTSVRQALRLCGFAKLYSLLSDEGNASLMRWLDGQPERSVIYVAFGSEAPLTPDHLRELALGLELADVRFVWVPRRPSDGGGGGQLLLPDGFEERVARRGVVCVGWVPQVHVLAHDAVGAFLTHARWSSLVESFLFGHPLVMLPLFADQSLTARAMAARAVGLEVPRDEEDGSFGRCDVASTVPTTVRAARGARSTVPTTGHGGRGTEDDSVAIDALHSSVSVAIPPPPSLFILISTQRPQDARQNDSGANRGRRQH